MSLDGLPLLSDYMDSSFLNERDIPLMEFVKVHFIKPVEIMFGIYPPYGA